MSDNTSPTVFCVSSSLALFLHPDLGLTGFFTQSWDLLVSSPSLGLTDFWFLHPVLGLTGSFTQTWDLLVSGFFTQLGTYWFLHPAWDLLISGFFARFLISSLVLRFLRLF